MKKIGYLLICILIANQAMAQDNLAEVYRVGQIKLAVKTGFTMFRLKGNGLFELSAEGKSSNLNGFFTSLEGNIELNRFLGLQHSIAFIQKGALLQLKDEQGRLFDSKYRNTYLEISPVSFTVNLKMLQLFAGPYFSLLTASSIQRKDSSGNLYKDKSIFGDASSEGDYTQKMDAGFSTGMNFNRKQISVGFRYVHGLAPVIENSAHIHGQGSIYNRGLVFSAGYRF